MDDSNNEPDTSQLDRYISTMTTCNTLALLATQQTVVESLQRMLLLTRLKSCWMNGHQGIRLICSCNISSEIEPPDEKPAIVNCANNDTVQISNERCSSNATNDDIQLGLQMRSIDSTVNQIPLELSPVVSTRRGRRRKLHTPKKTTISSASGDLPSNTDGKQSDDNKPIVAVESSNTVCNICNHRLLSVASLSRHMQRCHNIEHFVSDAAESSHTVCNICNQRLLSTASLSRHMLRRHNTEYFVSTDNEVPAECMRRNVQEEICSRNTNEVPKQQRQGTKSGSGGGGHVCQVCGRQFRLRHFLTTHSVTHTGERPFACRYPGCEKRFGQKSSRNYHERTHSDVRPYVCAQCGLGFKYEHVMRKHIARRHGGDTRTHQCTLCGKLFKTPGALRSHTIGGAHSDARPYVCDECPKRFKCRYQVVRHRRDVHSGDVKPLRCAVCAKGFTQASNMRTHMRTHTGEKPYACEECGERFAHSGTLKGHILTHRQNNCVITCEPCES